jgi:hypothetical protein
MQGSIFAPFQLRPSAACQCLGHAISKELRHGARNMKQAGINLQHQCSGY